MLKPAPETPLTSLALGQLALEAGLPAGVLNVVTGGDDVGVGAGGASRRATDLADGRQRDGQGIMRAASDTLKRVHMELGGKAPFIVFDDADLEAAAQGAVVGGFVNTGQDCTAATRIYVQRASFDAFVKRYLELVGQVRVGDPASQQTDMGPLVSAAQLAAGRGAWCDARRASGRFRAGGERASVAGMEQRLLLPADGDHRRVR